MSSAWNWLGIFIWLIIIAYVLWMINNVHSRKKKLIKVAMNRKKHGLASDLSKNNFEITLFEVLILIVLLFGIGKTTFHHHVKDANSTVTEKYYPLTKSQTKRNMKRPNAKVRQFYIRVNQSRARNFKQKYQYAINGKKVHSASSNTMIISRDRGLTKNHNLSYMTQKLLGRKAVWKQLAKNKPGVVRITTVYKNTPANGVGLHAGQKVFYYTIVKVPGKKGIYVNKAKLKKKPKIKTPKG